MSRGAAPEISSTFGVTTPEIKYQSTIVYIAATTRKSTGVYEAGVVIENSSKIGN